MRNKFRKTPHFSLAAIFWNISTTLFLLLLIKFFSSVGSSRTVFFFSFLIFECERLLIGFVSSLFALSKMAEEGAESTWGKIRRLSALIPPRSRTNRSKTWWINDEIGRPEVSFLFNQTHTYTHTHTYIYIYIYIYICVCVCVCVCTHTPINWYTYMHTHIHANRLCFFLLCFKN